MTGQVAICPEAITTFVGVAFAGLDGFVCCRRLAEKGMPGRRPHSRYMPTDAGLVDALRREAETALDKGAACFVVPATVATPGHARAGDIAATAAIVVDLDDGNIPRKRAHLVAHLGEPTLEVASGGLTEARDRKLHLYWRLSRPATGTELATVAEARALIARKGGGDASLGRLHQPIRLPGSVHGKYGRKAAVEILAQRDVAFDLGVLAATAREMSALEGVTRALPRPSRVRAGGLDGVTRFDAISGFIGARLRDVRLGRTDLDRAWDEVQDYNRNVLDPPWSEDRLRQEFDALVRVDADNHTRGTFRPGECASEDEIARRLAARYGAHWKHAAAMGGWLHWDGTHWAPVSPKGVLELARECCREAAMAAPQHRTRLLSNRTIQAVARLAASDARMSADGIVWDADPMLLNTPGGILDLRTGEWLPGDPAAAMTRITAVAPGGDCPLWKAFLSTFTCGDPEMAAYLARVAGYCLTGKTTEQVFFFLHGPGANGKSVFIGALADALGSYATTAPLETFMASRSDRHPTELAGLRGTRLVSVIETEKGRAWAESRIKAVTGGDRIQARLMHRDFFEFLPTFKLVIAGNHRPRLTGYGEVMRRRLHLTPCNATIPESERDLEFRERLRAEAGGILSWAIAGCAEWQRIGLAPPDAVRSAARAYFDDEDHVGQWFAERCVMHTDATSASRDLFADWSAWAQRTGTGPGSAREFGERLGERGLQPVRTARNRGWRGIRLREEHHPGDAS